MAITDKLRVTRNQLAEFIEKHDTIRQFERLFDYVNTFVIPDSPTEVLVQNLAHPIGEIYWQLPNKEDPNVLYPGQTWINISSDFAGDFFRSEGGNASAFESGQQLDKFQGHWHQDYNSTDGGGAIRVQYKAVSINDLQPPTNTGTREAITDGVNGTPRVGDETNPVNHTIRVWERTA